MRIFGYAIAALFSVSLFVAGTLLWQNYGFDWSLIFYFGFGVAGLGFLINQAVSLKPKGRDALPPGHYQVLAISSEGNPGLGRPVILKRWPDESDEYGSPQIFCVRLDCEDNRHLFKVGAELEFSPRRGRREFNRVPAATP